jgi:hypothetical protein
LAGGTASGTIVAGQRRFVVWGKDGSPIDAFPRFDGDLADRAELQNFPESLLKEPPPGS